MSQTNNKQYRAMRVDKTFHQSGLEKATYEIEKPVRKLVSSFWTVLTYQVDKV